MKEQIIGIICDILKLTHEELELRVNDVDIWDSLVRVEILFAIEEELNIHFNEEELAEITTPLLLIKAVEKRENKL